jgi:hypothetical protein
LKAVLQNAKKAGMRGWLFPWGVQFEREDSGVGLEIGVGGEDGPFASDGDGADQHIGNRYDDSVGFGT